MANTFPDTPTYTGFNAPRRIEGEVFDLEVEGELPAELNGSFYRSGPEFRFPPRLGDDININADGRIAAVRLPFRIRAAVHGSRVSAEKLSVIPGDLRASGGRPGTHGVRPTSLRQNGPRTAATPLPG